MNLKGRHFLTLKDYTPEEIAYLLELSADLKKKKKEGVLVDTLRGKNVALIFEKTSTRTRCSFEVAAHDLGMGTTYLDPKGSQLGKKESIADTAKVLGSMYEGIGNSYMIACAKMGMDFVACAPKKYFPNEELVAQCQEYAKASGATITLTEDVMEGTKDADVICTDVWVSMGEPDEVWAERIKDLSPYKVTKEVMANGKKEAIFLHCLPSFHDLNTGIGKEMGERFGLKDMEVTDEVFQSEQSKVFQEAENRMHTIKAVMAATLGA